MLLLIHLVLILRNLILMLVVVPMPMSVSVSVSVSVSLFGLLLIVSLNIIQDIRQGLLLLRSVILFPLVLVILSLISIAIVLLVVLLGVLLGVLLSVFGVFVVLLEEVVDFVLVALGDGSGRSGRLSFRCSGGLNSSFRCFRNLSSRIFNSSFRGLRDLSTSLRGRIRHRIDAYIPTIAVRLLVVMVVVMVIIVS